MILQSKFLFLFALVFGWMLTCSSPKNSNEFVQIHDGQFVLDGEPYTFVGTNFWYGAYLGSPGETGDLQRLRAELDLLKEIGVTNLRVLGSSEESPFENSLTPTFQYADGSVDEDLLTGLDVLLDEMRQRGMKAVIFLNNYWEWSGGMSTYNGWFGDGPVIDPADGDWEAFMKYSARFYKNKAAQDRYREFISLLTSRVNSVNGIPYAEDPTIMSWQLANEPRPGRGASSIPDIPVYVNWIDQTARFIKESAPFQLVSTGSEGEIGSLDSMGVFIEAHALESVDYLTFHMWAKNWGWFKPDDMEGTFPRTLANAADYLERHIRVAEELDKPIVMEEFGLFRDGEEYAQGSPVTYRDRYYEMVFEWVEREPAFAGTNFWSWGGFGEAQHSDYHWRVGDPFVGDPPQEPQGLNSVFAGDESTIAIIKAHAERLTMAAAKALKVKEEAQTAKDADLDMDVIEANGNITLFDQENLVAWCVVPYDKAERSPAQRAAMLSELGFKKMAWDWRDRHLPLFEEEIYQLRLHGIDLTSAWFWLDNRASNGLLEHHDHILNTLAKTNTKTTLWVSYDNDFYAGLSDERKLQKAVKSVGLILERARAQGLNVALYNHGDWFGEPENQIRILEQLGVGPEGSEEIGLVYNFHHAHGQIEAFPELLRQMLPYLWTVNINGMQKDGEKIMDVGTGNLEQDMLKELASSGFSGTIGILGHIEDEDVQRVLVRNLEGLEKITATL